MVADALSAAIGKRSPKTARGKRVLRKRESQAKEGAKNALIIAGNRVSHEAQNLLKDLHRVRTPLSQMFSRTHQMHPFEDVEKLENLCSRNDHGLFAFASSSKKRPLRLIIGRLFDNQLLDMQEFAVSDYKSIQSFRSSDATLGAKPLILFQGSTFESDETMKRAKSLLLDFFSGPRPEKVMAQGLEHVVVCSAVEGAKPAGTSNAAPPALQLKRFRMKMTKSGSKLPHVDLVEVGPSLKMELDRTRDPDRERWKQAIKVPKEVKVQKVKNVSKDSMGKRDARVHLGKQDFDQIHTVHHGEAKRKKLKLPPGTDAPKASAGAAAS